MEMDAYRMLEEDALAWERWEQRVEAAFEDEYMPTITEEISLEMRDMLLEAFKAGASWIDPLGG